jgi:hypothetical protein
MFQSTSNGWVGRGTTYCVDLASVRDLTIAAAQSEDSRGQYGYADNRGTLACGIFELQDSESGPQNVQSRSHLVSGLSEVEGRLTAQTASS